MINIFTFNMCGCFYMCGLAFKQAQVQVQSSRPKFVNTKSQSMFDP